MTLVKNPGPRFTTAATLVLLVASTACGPEPTRGELISTSLSIASYARSVVSHGAVGAATTFSFPVLEIYNGAGTLVYRGQESLENARILREMPSSMRGLPPQDNAPKLAGILDAIPEFKASRQKILGRGSPVVLSIGLEGCHACAIQEDALDDVRGRMLRSSIDVLEIEVSSTR